MAEWLLWNILMQHILNTISHKSMKKIYTEIYNEHAKVESFETNELF